MSKPDSNCRERLFIKKTAKMDEICSREEWQIILCAMWIAMVDLGHAHAMQVTRTS